MLQNNKTGITWVLVLLAATLFMAFAAILADLEHKAVKDSYISRIKGLIFQTHWCAAIAEKDGIQVFDGSTGWRESVHKYVYPELYTSANAIYDNDATPSMFILSPRTRWLTTNKIQEPSAGKTFLHAVSMGEFAGAHDENGHMIVYIPGAELGWRDTKVLRFDEMESILGKCRDIEYVRAVHNGNKYDYSDLMNMVEAHKTNNRLQNK